MSVIVQKYGGTSVGDIHRLRRVARRIAQRSRQGDRIVVVVSAMGDSTDRLIALAHQANPEPSEREMDQLVSTGEQISAALLTMVLHHLGLDAVSLTGNQVGIITDTHSSCLPDAVVFQLIKFFKDMFQFPGGDSNPFIPN